MEFCPSKPKLMGTYSLSVIQNLVWHRLMRLQLNRCHILQRCLNMFKLNKCAKFWACGLMQYCLGFQPSRLVSSAFDHETCMRLIWYCLTM